MEYLNVGKIVNTHGIKGEVRILSSFSDKSIFNVGNLLYVGDEILEIASYRVHKNYDMVTFKNINDINDVLKYKGLDVYVKRETINGFIVEDLIGYAVYGNKYVGKVKELISNVKYIILVLDNSEKKIYIKEIEGLINEN